MKAYLARLNAEQGGHQLVGFYFAESLLQLYDMIDECCDVDRVEIMELGPGGVYWGDHVDYAVPYAGDDIETAPSLPAGANVCEWWLDALFHKNEREWGPLRLPEDAWG